MCEFMCSQSKKMGPYWPQPGRSINENLLLDIAFPTRGDGAAEAVWDTSSATRVTHKLVKPGLADIAWTRGEAPEETFRMEVCSLLSPSLLSSRANRLTTGWVAAREEL